MIPQKKKKKSELLFTRMKPVSQEAILFYFKKIESL